MPLEPLLKSLSIQSDIITHDPVSNNDIWASVLKDLKTPDAYELTKTLVFKPKTAKSQPSTLIILLALNSTPTSSAAAGKAVSAKDLRLASPELVAETFGHEVLRPENVSVFSINKENVDKVKIVLDAKIVKYDAVGAGTAVEPLILAVHPSDSSKTVFVKATDLVSYLISIGANFTVVDFSENPDSSSRANTSAISTPSNPKQKPASKIVDVDSTKIDGAALIGITADKNLDFPGWYQQILTKGEMLDYYDVSGCYIMRPASYFIWEQIQDYFNMKIKSIGVQNSYFPMFVSAKVLEKEKDHIEGFAPEVAWVTRAGKSELEEPIAIRPTSETVMYPYYSKWIRSHRDLPLKLNQWNSVVRWEFKHPQPFIRTREFLWQEGHTAHLTFEEADKEVLQILDWYEKVYSDLLAVPVVKGRKTENEKFAGGYFTTTVEGYIPATGRGIQGATSHCLGQNFSKMFNITVENPEGSDKPKLFAWQNSWGFSTRSIGVMVMVHSDNKGLVLPPRVAQTQVVIVPVGITAKTTPEQREDIINGCKNIETLLQGAGIRVLGDYRENYSPGWKFADWELRGVPVRLEFGPKEFEKSQVVAVRRYDGVKCEFSLETLDTEIPKYLDEIHDNMLQKAKQLYDSHIVKTDKLSDFVPALNNKNVLLAPFCGGMQCEDEIKEKTARQGTEESRTEAVDEKAPSMGAKSLCIPFEQPKLEKDAKCIGCGQKAEFYTMFGRSY